MFHYQSTGTELTYIICEATKHEIKSCNVEILIEIVSGYFEVSGNIFIKLKKFRAINDTFWYGSFCSAW